MNISILSLIFIVSSCSTLPNPNLNLLKSWTSELQEKEPSIPYAKEYSNKNKKLIFLGASHGRDLNSETHIFVKNIIENTLPNLVIIEGVETQYGLNPAFVLKRISNNPPKMNEGSYAAKISSAMKIPFIGGEISESAIKESFQSDPYFTSRDLLAFKLIQGFATFNHEQPNLTLTEAMNEVYSYIDSKNELKGDDVINEKELSKWFKASSGKDFNYHELTTNDVAPKCDISSTKIQQINCKINKLRNTHIVNLISAELKKYKSILIVYGAGHQVQQDDVLKSFLSETRYLEN